MMTAVRVHAFGGPETMEFDQIPCPDPKLDEILVKVCAASVNPIDYKIRSGKFAKKEELPIALGRDIAGIVEKRGGISPSIHRGDRVFAMLDRDHGGYCEYAVVKADAVAHLPERIDTTRAAAVPLAATTAWQGLIDHGKLEKGQRVLIHGGAGGVGHLAVQIAKAKGAFVATTVAKDDVEFVRGLGADQIVDYRSQKFEDEVRDVDLVFDLVGGDTQERSFEVVKPGGIIVSTLQMPSQEKTAAKKIRGAHYMAQPNGDELAEIAALIDDGKVKPVVYSAIPLAHVQHAHDMLEHDHVRGKIVLEMVPSLGAKGASSGSCFSSLAT